MINAGIMLEARLKLLSFQVFTKLGDPVTSVCNEIGQDLYRLPLR